MSGGDPPQIKEATGQREEAGVETRSGNKNEMRREGRLENGFGRKEG